MLKLRRLFRGIATLTLLAPASLFAAGGGGEAIVFVADSRRYSGWQGYFTNLYNESLAQFTLLTVICIPLLAIILSYIMSFLLARTGIDLKSKAVGGH